MAITLSECDSVHDQKVQTCQKWIFFCTQLQNCTSAVEPKKEKEKYSRFFCMASCFARRIPSSLLLLRVLVPGVRHTGGVVAKASLSSTVWHRETMASLATADSSSSSSTGTTKLKIDGADVPVSTEAGVDVAVVRYRSCQPYMAMLFHSHIIIIIIISLPNQAINSTPFKDWLALKDKTLAVKAIHFQGIDM